MNEQEVIIVSAVRTAIGKFNGQFKDISAVDLGAAVIAPAIERSGLSASDVQEVFMGNVLQAGLGQNPARQAALKAGLPVSVPATTVNQVCGSGLMAVQLAYRSIRSGEGGILLAGGMENMSRSPHLLQNSRSGLPMGDRMIKDSMIVDGLWCAQNDVHMGITAENICEAYSLEREELDRYAHRSQMKAASAVAAGRFREEIIPIEIPQSRGPALIANHDEYIRSDTTMDALSKLRPAFAKGGKVTAGNASGINDGAAALVLASRREVEARNLTPLASIRSCAVVGVDPAFMGLGPIPAAEQALAKAGLSMSDINVIEANEAFASQALVFAKHFGLDDSRLNVGGGAIALGHPIGASGARIVVTLLHEMARREARYGMAALCVGGGQGIAIILERGVEQR